MSGHRLTADLLKADFDQGDPGSGGSITATGNWTVVEMISAGAEARSLKDPVKSGQIIVLTLKTNGGTVTVTAATAYNKGGDTTLAFDAALETIILVSIPNGTSGYRWSSLGVETGTEDTPTFG